LEVGSKRLIYQNSRASPRITIMRKPRYTASSVGVAGPIGMTDKHLSDKGTIKAGKMKTAIVLSRE